MAYAWVFESNFEAGSNAEWDSETDTGSKLSFPHYSELARIDGLEMPFRGAYCAMIDLRSGDTNDHTLTEGDIDIADAATRYFRWYMYVDKNFTATADDVFNIFELQQAGGTIEVSTGFRITAASNLLEIGVGDGTAPATFVSFPRGKWVAVELAVLVSTGGAGTVTLYLDGTSVVALTSQTHAAAVGAGVLGTQNTLSTTTGIILLDQFVMDDGRVYPIRNRFDLNRILTKSQHIFVGPGWVDGAALLTTTASDALKLYDTDTANTNDEMSAVTELVVGNQTAVSGPLYFERGCYAQITGSTARAAVYLPTAGMKKGVIGPLYYSRAGMQHYGFNRKQRPGNV
jgi:hypothetical protein